MAIALDTDFRSLALPTGAESGPRRSSDAGSGEDFANSLKLARADGREPEQASQQGPASAAFTATSPASLLEPGAATQAEWTDLPGAVQTGESATHPVLSGAVIPPEVTELATDREIIRASIEAAKFGTEIPAVLTPQNASLPSAAPQINSLTSLASALPPNGAAQPPNGAAQLAEPALAANPVASPPGLPAVPAEQPEFAQALAASNLTANAQSGQMETGGAPADPAALAATKPALPAENAGQVAAEAEVSSTTDAEATDTQPSGPAALGAPLQPAPLPQGVALHADAAPAQSAAMPILVPSPATPAAAPAQASRQGAPTITPGAAAKPDHAALRGPQSKLPSSTDAALPETSLNAVSSSTDIFQTADGSALATSGTGVVAMTSSATPAPQQTVLPSTPVPMAPAQAVLIASPAEVVDIVSKTAEDGQSDRVVVQLDPPELGRVSIDFKFDAQGLQHVTITSETPEAMRQLRLMHSELVQALERQGIGSQNMTFEHQQQNAERAPLPNPFIRPGITGDTGKPVTDAVAASPNLSSPGRTLPGGRLDIRL